MLVLRSVELALGMKPISVMIVVVFYLINHGSTRRISRRGATCQ